MRRLSYALFPTAAYLPILLTQTSRLYSTSLTPSAPPPRLPWTKISSRSAWGRCGYFARTRFL
jgi:hypothetical protein